MSGQLLEASLVEAFAAFGAHPRFEVFREIDHVRTRTPADIPFLNNVFGLPQAKPPRRDRIAQIARSFAEVNVGSVWYFRDDGEAHPEFFSAFSEYGFSFSGRVPGMWLKEYLPPQLPADLEIVEVDSDRSMADWFRVWGEVYDPTSQILPHYISIFEALGNYKNPAFRFFVGRVDGKTVSCASAFDDGKALGLFNAATLVGWRKRGYGMAVLGHCLERSRPYAAYPVYNLASKDGFSPWSQLGFEKVCDFHQFFLPAGATT